MKILACPVCRHSPLNMKVFHGKEEVVEGLIFCKKCNRWYPIIDEIPIMLPDEMRNGADDIPFLFKWKKLFPKKIFKNGKPFNEKAI